MIVPLRRKGDSPNPNIALVNLSVSMSFDSMLLIQWNLKASLSSFRILICRIACLRSPVKVTGHILCRIRTFQGLFRSGGPTSVTSFSEGDGSFTFADASNTILILVLPAACRITGQCG